VTKKYLFEKFNEFLEDEELSVKMAAIETIMKICHIFDAETKISFLIPLWRKFCTENDSKLTKIIAQKFGLFIYTVKSR
jgi:hypothetical protein